MGVILRQHGSQRRYVQIANGAVRDDRLSLKARGLLAVLLSHRDGWETSERRIAEGCQEGRHAVATGLTELEEYGYLWREQTRNDDGTMGPSLWHMTDEPQPSVPSPDEPRPDNPTTDDPAEVDPTTKNPNGLEPEGEEPDRERTSAPDVAAEESPFPDVATEETIEHARYLCNLFAGYVKSNGHAIPTTRSARDGWLVEMERLVRIGPPGDVPWPDDPEDVRREIVRVMAWALAESSFWPANVRSVPKFREQFTRLRAQADRSSGTTAKRSKYERLQREGLT